jgi:hypothetical protein
MPGSSIFNHLDYLYIVGISLKVENDRMIVSRVLNSSASHLSGKKSKNFHGYLTVLQCVLVMKYVLFVCV